jgi:plastocyanin
MNESSNPPEASDAAIDSMTAALRDAGAAEPLPPELRRTTLEALWVADAARHERSASSRGRLLRRTGRLAAVLTIVACGVGAAALGVRSWRLSKEHRATFHIVRNARPPATAPATAPAEAEDLANAPSEETPSVVGRVRFVGARPVPEKLDLSGDAACAAMHPDGLFDESVLLGDTGGLANVVLSVELAGGVALPAPQPVTTPTFAAVLDQRRCRFVPHVLAVRVGDQVVIKNSDNLLHNVQALTVNNPPFNIGQPGLDRGYRTNAMRAAERYRVRCSVHPWMNAWVNVFAHPYFAVTNPDGAYAIPGPLPDGRYTLTAWHEKFGEKQAKFELKDGKAVTMDLTFDAPTLPG